jgi:transposase
MRLYSGIDLHSNNCVVTVINEKGLTVYEKRIANDIEMIKRVLLPHKESLAGTVVESTYNWYWLVDGLQEANFKVHLANTTAIQQYSGIKNTNDKTDARWLAEMLRLNILPTGYICPVEQRAIRDLARKRLQLVSQRTCNLLSLQTLITRLTSVTMKCRAIKKLTEEDLKNIIPNPNQYVAARANLRLLQQIDSEEEEITKEILRQIKLTPIFQKLTEVPGIGKTLAITIMLETGDIHRFPKVGNYASYCRCVGSKKESNGKSKGKNNTKNGNKYLSWAFIEAANFAIRYYPEIKKFYQRKLSNSGGVVAIKAVAHKLARASYHILKNGDDFDMSKAF